MWIQKNNRKGKYYWYEYSQWDIYKYCYAKRTTRYLRPAKWWEVILNKLFKWQPK